uniref:Uncharacterized protein n=1 Tax=Salix viminalis TaxID=40686 RepID=A0A6N2KH48_SALVM
MELENSVRIKAPASRVSQRSLKHLIKETVTNLLKAVKRLPLLRLSMELQWYQAGHEVLSRGLKEGIN